MHYVTGTNEGALKCRTCRKPKGPECVCCAERKCRWHQPSKQKDKAHAEQWEEMKQPFAGREVQKAIAVWMCETGLETLKGHKGEMLPGGRLHPGTLTPEYRKQIEVRFILTKPMMDALMDAVN